jgi:hypothetical protein
MTALLGAQETSSSARFKRGNETRTVKLKMIPGDMTEESFLEAARKGGVDLSVKVDSADKERGRNINGKGVYGAAAASSAASVLGIPLPTPDSDPVPDSVKKRGRGALPVPSENGKPTTDGTAK